MNMLDKSRLLTNTSVYKCSDISVIQHVKTMSKLALGLTQPFIQCVPGALSLGVKLTTHIHLVLTSRMHGVIPPLLQYAFMAWCSVEAQGQLYLYSMSKTRAEVVIWQIHHDNASAPQPCLCDSVKLNTVLNK
jgi:hypothetical protein